MAHEPAQALAAFLEECVLGWEAVLTVKSASRVSMNAHGEVALARIERWDEPGRPEEVVVTRADDGARVPSGKEPPFHIHLNGWEKVAGVRLDDHGAKFLKAEFPCRLDFLDASGGVLFWLYVRDDHARALERELGHGRESWFVRP